MKYTLSILLLLNACKPHTGKERDRPDTHQTTQTATTTIPRSVSVTDNSYTYFLDSLLTDSNILFSARPVKAGEAGRFSESEGFELKEPYSITIGKKEFPVQSMDIVNDDNRLRYIRYQIDTAMEFSFHRKRYAYIEAHYYDCNGSGCMEAYFMILDHLLNRVHVFVTYAIPEISRPYVCDINKDGKLDVMVPECQCLRPDTYCDTAETVLFRFYTLDSRGRFKPLEDGYRRNSILIGQFDGGIFNPVNFRIIGDFMRR